MKKNELMNGDMVVLKSGQIGVVILNEKEGYLMFSKGGYESLDEYYNDDMVYEDEDDAVMQVYRSPYGQGFNDLEDTTLIYERDYTWVNPAEEEVEQAEDEREALEAQWAEQAKENKKNSIFVIAQGFYGNRTGTDVRREKIDRFILGYIDDSIDFGDPIDRSIIRIPNTDNLVLIYNKFSEEKRLLEKEKLLAKENYHLKPLAVIPELDIELYSRCIVCRMNEDGEFDSLQDEDCEKFMQYLSF